MSIISSRIKELRHENNLTQKQIADVLGCKPYNVGDWERGRVEPDIDTIIALAKYFEVTTDYLLGVTEY